MEESLHCSYLKSDEHGHKYCVTKGCQDCGCKPEIKFPYVKDFLSDIQLDEQNINLRKVRSAVACRSAALVLGAGVSIPSGLPDWVGLVSRMMGHAIQYNQISSNKSRAVNERMTDALIRGDLRFLNGINTLESGQYVKQLFDDPSLPRKQRDQLPELAMKEMIFRMINDSLTGKELLAKCFCRQSGAAPFSNVSKEKKRDLAQRWEEWEDVKKKGFPPNGAEQEKELLGEIYRCIEGHLDLDKDQAGIARLSTIFAAAYLSARENGIRNVMTYNYDPLLQECMLELYGLKAENLMTHPGRWSEKFNRVEKEGVREIFHVHGFVPGRRHLSKKEKIVYPEESERLILSEDSYYEVEQNGTYNWSSSIQSYFLNKYNCIFVGFSAEDYNFKRILRQQGSYRENEEPSHYLILAIDDLIRNTFKDVCRYHMQTQDGFEFVAEEAKTSIQYILECKQKYWRRFGICPVWVTVGEIPELLVSLISQGSSD